MQVKRLYPYFNAILNTYALLFFSNNRVFAVLLLFVSFFNPYAGLSGLLAVCTSVFIGELSGLPKWSVHTGLYSYNALYIGIGMGTFYNIGTGFFLLLFVAVLLSVVLSAVLQNKLSKLGLPFLSLPFILCFWLILLVTKEFSAIDLSTRNIYWLNEMYAIGDQRLVRFVLFMENLGFHPLVATFFRSLSSIFFQNNLLAGLLIAFGILLHSRILFSLLVLGYISAYAFNFGVGAYEAGINYYLMGVNFLMVSVAIGGFFVIPSMYSYLWAILSVPVTFVMVIGLGKIMGIWLLPVYSLPFCITVLLLLYFFMLRLKPGSLVLTPLQLFSPEKNLYTYLNNKERLLYRHNIRLQLPFLGQWMVSQGYEGSITHKGDWSKALDFIIVDDELKTYYGQGITPEHFYCFNKPVTAPANGFVQEVVGHIEDNPIGQVNKDQNWGNTIIIKHGEGIFTKMSHLKKNSIKVKAGDYVRTGDIVAACGNSGRSPEPHLHFQVQSTPFIGSRTIEYPFATFVSAGNQAKVVHEFAIPAETQLVSNLAGDSNLKAAFQFQPGFKLSVRSSDGTAENWEVFTNAYNQSYLYSYETKATAYFEVNESFFLFTAYYGSKKSLLYCFYVAAYRVMLSTHDKVSISDQFPLVLRRGHPLKWLQDLVAPFYVFSKLLYVSANVNAANDIFSSSVEVRSQQTLTFVGRKKLLVSSDILVSGSRIEWFTFKTKRKNLKVTCSENAY